MLGWEGPTNCACYQQKQKISSRSFRCLRWWTFCHTASANRRAPPAACCCRLLLQGQAAPNCSGASHTGDRLGLKNNRETGYSLQGSVRPCIARPTPPDVCSQAIFYTKSRGEAQIFPEKQDPDLASDLQRPREGRVAVSDTSTEPVTTG